MEKQKLSTSKVTRLSVMSGSVQDIKVEVVGIQRKNIRNCRAGGGHKNGESKEEKRVNG